MPSIDRARLADLLAAEQATYAENPPLTRDLFPEELLEALQRE